MSADASSIGPRIAVPDYGRLGSFASSTKHPPSEDAWGHVWSFLSPNELAGAESVCRSWNRAIIETKQWKNQYQTQLNSAPTDPVLYIRGCRSYKQTLQALRSRVYDAAAYRYYLGAETDSAPIPSLKRFNEPDPCEPTKTISQNYVWIHSPPYFKITVDGSFPFKLDKSDDPNDEEAPSLVMVGLMERFKLVSGLGSKSEKTVLKVPNTIHNLGVLFGHPKNGNPSGYGPTWDAIFEQHGNKRIPAGQICMREEVIGRNLTFAQQEAAAAQAKVVIPQLGHRILYNFLKHAETNSHSGGQNRWTFARTSTTVAGNLGIACPVGCGSGGPSGLDADYHFDDYKVGVAVALPAEVQAVGP